MKLKKKQESDVEIVQTEEVELSEEQLELVAGGTMGDCTNPEPWKPIIPDQI